MDELIRQIRAASDAGFYYLALMGSLMLPDICGALASDNGRATPSKFKDWLTANVPEQAADAAELWGLRCSLLHQGSATPRGGHFPVACMFPHPSVPQLHNLSTESASGDRVGWLSIPIFVEEVTRGAEVWYAKYGKTARVKRNMERFARLRLEGLPPHVVGAPVIA
jgi:hypothetical protein